MKYWAAIVGLFFWLIFTVALVCTGVGAVIIAMNDEEYFDIPASLLEVFKDK